jgi:hypothetical protein
LVHPSARPRAVCPGGVHRDSNNVEPITNQMPQMSSVIVADLWPSICYMSEGAVMRQVDDRGTPGGPAPLLYFAAALTFCSVGLDPVAGVIRWVEPPRFSSGPDCRVFAPTWS